MTTLLVVGDVALLLAVLVCGAILWELRRARLEASRRGARGKALLEEQLDEAREQQAIDLVLEEEARRTRKLVERVLEEEGRILAVDDR